MDPRVKPAGDGPRHRVGANLDGVSRAQPLCARLRGLWGCAAATDLRFTRGRPSNVRKSGKPDLCGSYWSVAVPDQRCHSASKTRVNALLAPLRYALHRVRDSGTLSDVFVAIFTVSNSPSRSRGAISASGSCTFASPTPE